MALDLAAGGFGNRALAYQDNGERLQFMSCHDVSCNKFDEGVEFVKVTLNNRSWVFAHRNLLHHDEALFPFDLHRERRSRPRQQDRMALLDGKFYILWIVILPANDK